MAEVIGVVTGISGLIGLTFSLGRLSYEYITTVRAAEEATSRYLQEVLALGTVLVELQKAISSPDTTKLPADQLKLLANAVTSCEKDMKTLQTKLEKHKDSALRSLTWPFQERETKALVEMLHRWRGTFDSMISASNLQVSRETLSEVREAKLEEKKVKLLNWISPNALADTHAENIRKHCPGTCSWVLNKKTFKNWINTNGRLLVCYGSPGVGKTIFTSFIVNHLRQTTNWTVLHHFFDYSPDQASKHTTEAVARNLLRQLVQSLQNIPADISDLYEKHLTDANEVDIWLELCIVAIRNNKNVVIIIDGLDESPDQNRTLQFITRLVFGRSNVLLTTRPNVDLSRLKRRVNYQKIKLKAPSTDMENYVHYRIDADEDFSEVVSTGLKSDIAESIVRYTDGVFLLGRLALESLLIATTPRQVRRSLSSLPKDLPSAYEATYGRIMASRTSTKHLALRILSCLRVAKRTLSMSELLCILAIELDDYSFDPENLDTPRTVLAACQGLIECRGPAALVRYSHATVRDFLERQPTDQAVDAEHAIAHACVVYLQQDDFAKGAVSTVDDLDEKIASYPLLSYAASNWGLHAAGCELQLKTSIDALVAQPGLVASATQVLHYVRRRPNSTADAAFAAIPNDLTVFHVLAFWGLAHAAERHLSFEANVDSRDSLTWTPLHWAAARGHVPMITFLIDSGAAIEAKDNRLWTPLFWSAFWGQADASALLLSKGAQFSLRDVEGRSPLHIAISRTSSTVCEVLIKAGADTRTRSNDGYTAMENAQDSHDPNIRALFGIKASTPVRSEPRGPKPALIIAADDANEDEFKTVLAQETEASQREGWTNPLVECLDGLSPTLPVLRWNCSVPLRGHVPRPRDSDFDKMSYPNFVLWYALLADREDMVACLLGAGIGANQAFEFSFNRDQSRHCFTPLHLAVYRGSVSIIRLLLRHEAKPELPDRQGNTALHYAATLGHPAIIELFLPSISLVSTINDSGETALYKICKWNDYDDDTGQPTAEKLQKEPALAKVVDLLLSSGADVNLMTKSGLTPLMVAVDSNNYSLVPALLRAGADPNLVPVDTTGSRPSYNSRSTMTAFERAFSASKYDLVETMLSSSKIMLRSDPSLFSYELERLFRQGRAALIGKVWALGLRSLKTPPMILAMRFLDRAMKTGSYDQIFWEDGRPADPKLAPGRYKEVLRVLIDAGEDVNSAEAKTGETPLLLAVRHSYSGDIVRMLLDSGADVAVKNSGGLNAMHCAVQSGDLDIIKTIGQRPPFASPTCALDQEAAMVAVLDGHVEVVEYWLSQQDQFSPIMVPWLSFARLHRDINSTAYAEVAQHIKAKNDVKILNKQDTRGRTLLHKACEKGSDTIIQQLLTLGSDPKIQDKRGDTALHIAARKGRRKAIIELLVEYGGNVRTQNNGGNFNHREVNHATPLHLAVHSGNLETVKAILDARWKVSADPPPAQDTPTPDQQDDDDDTILVSPYPRLARRPRPLTPFIDIGASNGWYSSVDDGDGTTALMIAVGERQLETVKLLIERGANVNIMGGAGSGGSTALDNARERGDKEIVKLIVKNGGRSFGFDFYQDDDDDDEDDSEDSSSASD